MSIYACSDLHGQYKLWTKIKNYLQDDDKLFFLGDAIDRGSDGIKIMLEMLLDKRVVYLIGNHEEMMYEALNDFDIDLWCSNGGYNTYQKFNELSLECQEFILSSLEDLRKIPYYEYTNEDNQSIFLSHSGRRL